MPRYAYVNGRFVPHGQADVHIEDRGYQFADGVYEVIPVHRGGVVDEALHLDRLEYSLGELYIAMPVARAPMRLIARELMRRNELTNGFLYIQVTRGVAPRAHPFPKPAPRPALVMTTRQMAVPSEDAIERGISVVSTPDQRWARCDIKSLSLLPNVLAKELAASQGCAEAFQIDDEGFVTEAAASNAWIVTHDGAVVTRQVDTDILSGITRLSLQRVIENADYRLEIRPFTLDEAYNAREAFITASTQYVMPVTRIDDRVIGNGRAGILTTALRQAYTHHVIEQGEGADRFAAS